MKGYKAFDNGWKCRDFQYEIGKTYELPEGQELKICECGFHFCVNPIDVFGYYDMKDDILIAEVEALGEIQNEGTKYCTDKIKIVKELPMHQLQTLILDENCNTGTDNVSCFNSGNRNSGRYNSGNCNSGSYNSGSYNTGHGNSGNCNCGNYNKGGYNTGNYNRGYHNAGSYNSGSYNTGFYNSGNQNSGIFNTNSPKMMSFNKLTDITYSEFFESLDYDFERLLRSIMTKSLSRKDVVRIKNLPNFDAKIFEEITGINIEEV